MILIMADVTAFVADGMVTGSIVYLILFYFKFWDVEQNLIPYVRQMVFACISVLERIADAYVYWFFYKPHEVLVLPAHCTEIFQCSSIVASQYPSWDSSVGRAADCYVTGPRFNTHSWLNLAGGWLSPPSLCG